MSETADNISAKATYKHNPTPLFWNWRYRFAAIALPITSLTVVSVQNKAALQS
ncbi:hypothetical protein H6F77_08130 [Microcoleus sp. FACHB-831]|uniref:hypothetical protein n=1 Tax=Microcoleus sp. FACHB-831 TaxID=2692827 RepID=UPI0019B7E62E|nr:hypothetical protein [Microcoleus sp. FACHB-831]MBD1921056.1 hypothetical protein [Microcoleus sp. FACHB-831]